MLHIAGGIILAAIGLVLIAMFVPLALAFLGWLLKGMLDIIELPFLLFGWIKRKLKRKP
jgi:hypothetical protein